MKQRLMAGLHRFLIVLLLGLVMIQVAGCSQLPEDSYATYAQALQSGGFASGRLPAVIPDTATNIRAAQAVDSNQIWVSFDFPLDAVESFAALCSPVSFDEVDLPDSGPRWWDTQALKDPWNAFYVCGDQASLGYLALLGTGEQAYYWSYR